MTGTIRRTRTLTNHTPDAYKTSIQDTHHGVLRLGCTSELGVVTGGSACSSGSGVSCWEDSSVNTQVSLPKLSFFIHRLDRFPERILVICASDCRVVDLQHRRSDAWRSQ